ncbi:uncharacterized protein METZ01_LOCUS250815 [marine metagenome]|uniref:Uncharacterized protein n=1 Tax=marine metagenome TaxID=408172 RepID=A0A382IH33_9ZZZZ
MASAVDRAERVLTPCDRQEAAGTGKFFDAESRVIQHVRVAWAEGEERVFGRSMVISSQV